MKKHLLVPVLLAGFSSAVSGFGDPPAKKQLEAFRIETGIKVDGALDEAEWREAVLAEQFTQTVPSPGAPSKHRSEVRILYNDVALFVGAILYDEQPDSIMQELTDRDQLGNTDYFGIIIDAYKDGINGLGFLTTPAGVQFDLKYSALGGGGGPSIVQGGDTNWDAVWDVKTRRTPEGWSLEMVIPYSAIRFPAQAEQSWHVNFVRQVRRHREESFWNPVDPEQQGLVNQSGELNGIRDIKSPLRLSATPFVAVYAENLHDRNGSPVNSWGRSFNGGMDIRYGINDAFTLDMTLIPDFGEAISDNQVLNLSPFEVFFNENRQFFTEGVELFNKGGWFYSRRVGGRPLYYWDVENQLRENEEIISNPTSTQLLNATKISGRTKKGTGLGLFNASSGATHAELENMETGETRTIETNPFSNYNVLVFDQNLKNNSYVTLLNTNVWRSGSAYDANLTGTVFELRTKDNNYGLTGQGALSQQYHPDRTDLGHTYYLGLRKLSGQWRWGMNYGVESDTYDPNDLGFLYNNNGVSYSAFGSFNQYKPFGAFNNGGAEIWVGHNRLYKPDRFIDFGINANAWLTTKKFFAFGVWTYFEPLPYHDYFEPRVDGRFLKISDNYNFGGWLSTDYRKKLAFDLETNYRIYNEANRRRFNIWTAARYRLSDKWNIRLSNSNNIWPDDLGFTTFDENDQPILGRRDLLTIENSLQTNFSFSNRMVLSFRLRHYWSRVQYKQLFDLNEDGTLAPSDFDEFRDNSFNAFNIDCIYRWRFAPGSDLFIIWKNSIFGFDDLVETVRYDYRGSVDQLFELPQRNSLSLKLIYYLDYQLITSKI
ncbi:MAG: carbohydrate binding family 9 domain-containing protein [Saprospirales bacterium]|nr:carbohydrate binding family 9 domain-containing protein [Saprospirales bacterium]